MQALLTSEWKRCSLRSFRRFRNARGVPFLPPFRGLICRRFCSWGAQKLPHGISNSCAAQCERSVAGPMAGSSRGGGGGFHGWADPTAQREKTFAIATRAPGFVKYGVAVQAQTRNFKRNGHGSADSTGGRSNYSIPPRCRSVTALLRNECRNLCLHQHCKRTDKRFGVVQAGHQFEPFDAGTLGFLTYFDVDFMERLDVV